VRASEKDRLFWRCEQLPFAQSTPVPEASAAAWWTIDEQSGSLGAGTSSAGGKRMLLVVGDSGQHGAYGLVDPDSGDTRKQGVLPLGDAGDDIEGLAARGERLYGLTSAGWMRVWKRDGNDLQLVDGPYPIGDGDMICDRHRSNCKRNFEGLCLAPAAVPNAAGCAGYAASKTDGALYCLVENSGRFTVTRDHAIAIANKNVLADCAYGDDGSLWAADNLLGLSQVYRIEGETPVPVAQLGAGFPEVIAVRGDMVYRMSDAGGSPSLMTKFRCTPPSR
jgi:hypothetical protein